MTNVDQREEYTVDSVADALKLAEQFKRKGRYDWFRGQAHEWPLCPSLNRLDDQSRNEALMRLGWFAAWVRSTPEARHLKSDESKIAVAQHYRIATHFLDFTTSPRVAVFFAGHEPPEGAERGYLLCLRTADLQQFWSAVFPNLLPLRFLEFHVPDLWRLQAQHGVFLDCPYANIEDHYPFDRIVFPLKNTKCPVASAEIYPERKSRLEQLLDRYFQTEAQRATLSWLYEIGQGKNIVLNLRDPEKPPDHLVKSGRIPQEPSWSDINLRNWLTAPNESFSRVRTNERVRLRLPSQPQRAGRAASSNIRKLLATDSGVRSRAIDFALLPDAATESKVFAEVLPARLKTLWDGLRTLPYQHDELAAAIGIAVQLTMEAGSSREAQRPGSPMWREAAHRCFGEIIEIGFGAHGGGNNSACVGVRDLLAAVRSDLDSFLVCEDRNIRADVKRLLSAFPSPRQLFRFDALARLFALQAAPYQVCACTPPFFFSPAGLFTLGVP